MASAFIALVLVAGMPTFMADGHCGCKFQGQKLPTAAHGATGNEYYGTACMTWDQIPGTVYHKNDTECPTSKMCDKGCNFMNLEWCYVEQGCEGSHDTTLKDSNGNALVDETTNQPLNLAYSYAACHNPYCWNDFEEWNEGCPGGHGCDDPFLLASNSETCKCKFQGSHLPDEAANKSGNKYYGTACMKWDLFPGTIYYKNDTLCPPSKMCDKGCNFRNLEWCYVEPGCRGSLETTLTGANNEKMDLAYSYAACGNPYCWNDFDAWNEGCPGGDECAPATCGEVKQAYKAAACCGAPAGQNLHMPAR